MLQVLKGLKFKFLRRQQKNYPYTSHAIRSDVVERLGFRLGDGSTIVFQQHADVMSQLISSLGITLRLSAMNAAADIKTALRAGMERSP